MITIVSVSPHPQFLLSVFPNIVFNYTEVHDCSVHLVECSIFQMEISLSFFFPILYFQFFLLLMTLCFFLIWPLIDFKLELQYCTRILFSLLSKWITSYIQHHLLNSFIVFLCPTELSYIFFMYQIIINRLICNWNLFCSSPLCFSNPATCLFDYRVFYTVFFNLYIFLIQEARDRGIVLQFAVFLKVYLFT